MDNEFEECFCCDKMVRVGRPHWRVHSTTSGKVVPMDYEGEDSQGTFAIGPKCRHAHEHSTKVIQ